MTTQNQNAAIEDEAQYATPEAMEEFNELLGDLATKQRDPNIPEGTVLSETDINGIPVTFKKQSSMHHIDGVAVPDRLPLFQFPTNNVSMIPTALVFRRLAKMIGGHRVWSRSAFPDGQTPDFIEKEVPIMAGGATTKTFPNQLAYEQFMKNKHGDAWEAMQRQEQRDERAEDRAERAQDREADRALAQAVLASATGANPQVTQQPQIPLAALDHLDADGLKALADEFDVTLTDRRSTDLMRNEMKQYFGGGE
jgi:hypothetical protein